MNLPPEQPEARRTLCICNAKGLHARAASKLVKLAATFECEIWVMRTGMVVTAGSIMGLMMLGAAKGQDVEIWARGPQAPEAVGAIADLIERKFDEDD